MGVLAHEVGHVMRGDSVTVGTTRVVGAVGALAFWWMFGWWVGLAAAGVGVACWAGAVWMTEIGADEMALGVGEGEGLLEGLRGARGVLAWRRRNRLRERLVEQRR
jgi:Zn-dependent protease with chaperone function